MTLVAGDRPVHTGTAIAFDVVALCLAGRCPRRVGAPSVVERVCGAVQGRWLRGRVRSSWLIDPSLLPTVKIVLQERDLGALG